MTLPLHRKYRPQNFNQIVGNAALVESLKSVLLKEEGKPTTYLLQGPSGAGKTTLARIIAKELGADDQDIKELNVSDTRGIDSARQIINSSQFVPLRGKAKVFVLNECHRSTVDWQNCMLEILEEPPKNTYFILCTTEPERLLKAVRTRCTTYQVSGLLQNDIIKLLTKVCRREKKKISEAVLKEIAKVVDGSPRQALVVLDSLIEIDREEKQLEVVKDFSVNQSSIKDLCQALLQGNSWKDVSKIIKSLEEEPESIRYAVLGYMATVLLNGKNDRAAAAIEYFSDSFMYTKKAGLVYACYCMMQ
jgi:DNA polymerase-3 subunit gamma/tau